MQKQALINQIYWAPDNQNQYTYGSRISVSANNVVTFDNPVMASGKVMMFWRSQYGYQEARAVPQLPLLRVGEKYRLVVRGRSTPTDTFILRITFYNIQNKEIDHQDFHQGSNLFVFPEGAVNYKLELINAGCTSFRFKRIEIGLASLPEETFDELWLQDAVTDSQTQPMNLLVLSSGQRAKRNYPYLKAFAGDLPVQVLMVAWQYDGDLGKEITALLADNLVERSHIISCDPQFDQAVMEVARHSKQYEGLVTNHSFVPGDLFNVKQYGWVQNQHPLKSTVSEPDWLNLFSVIHQIWGGQDHVTRSN